MIQSNHDEQVMTVGDCREVHKQSLDKLQAIADAIEDINKRLYKDNGTISIQTRLDRQGRIISTVTAFLWVVGSAVMIQFTSFIISALKVVAKAM